jgi:ribosomal protein S18 acetylase RimI-like enzyme
VAWPALRQRALDGWLLRASEGFTGRANSVQALGASTRAIADKVLECERWYEAERLRCSFRITPFSQPGLDHHLEERGYTVERRSHVMVRPLTAHDAARAPEALELGPWVAAYARLSQLASPPRALEPLVRSIAAERLTACARDRGGRVVTVGMGVLDDRALGVFDLVTDAEARGRGHASRLIAGLIGWARARGAAHAYLQVLESNERARRLYAHLGFRRAYDYWYRVRPEPPTLTPRPTDP